MNKYFLGILNSGIVLLYHNIILDNEQLSVYLTDHTNLVIENEVYGPSPPPLQNNNTTQQQHQHSKIKTTT